VEARIVEFAGLLRQNGVRVSPAEVADAVEAAVAAGIADRETLRAALAATMVKRAADHETFDRLFALHFSGLRELLAGLEGSILRQLEEEGLLEGDDLEMLFYELAKNAKHRGEFADALIAGDQGALARLLRGAALQLDFSALQTPLQAGFYARRLLSGAGIGGAEDGIREIEELLRARGVDPAKMSLVSEKLAARLRAVEAAARKWVDREVEARLPKSKRNQDALAGKSFQNLSREELLRMNVAVRRVAEKLKSRLVRRQRSRRKGALNVRRTIRRNLSWGAVPMRLAFRARRPERPDVVVLCDVSDSVRNVSRLMLLFVHTLQSLFARVRSFAFVSDVGEITEYFKEVDADRAVDLAIAGQAINLYANSNYGRALALFARDHLGKVNGRTTVIVIGDGRNNFNPPNVWALRDIRRKAKRVVWICPEVESSWGFGDSEMAAYAREVDKVAVVQTLADLEAVAEGLVPAGGRGRV
jgi:uncharacterized protein with von Willebrand factor type A (vWA) domain